MSKISKAYSKLEQEYEREPSSQEIAEYLETTAEKISETLINSGHYVSMDAPFTLGEENTLHDVLISDHDHPADYTLMMESLSEEIKRSLSALQDRQRQIIVWFFGLGDGRSMSLEEIGEKMNLTRERVRQIKDKALDRLKSFGNSDNLKVFVN
jgi:RNA polymerase primary sigma factor